MKRSRIAVVASVALLSGTLFFAVPKPAKAWFFIDPFESMVATMLETMLTVMETTSSDMNAMGDRILVMADNIGIMADRILIMADKIGEMSDRIVATEQLMATLVSQQGPAALMISPVEASTVSLSLPIQIALTDNYTDYVLYLSNSADMSNATNALVQANDTTTAWSRASSYATGDTLYIAARAVNGSTMGELSNTVMIYLTP